MGLVCLPKPDAPRNGSLNGIGVVAALAAEARALGATGARSDGSLLLVSGIGAAAAGRCARSLIDSNVSALMTFGLAGGLDPALAAGTVVLPDEVIDRDGARFATSSEWRDRVRAAMQEHGAPVGGALLTSAVALESIAAKADAFRDTGAVAVDMESVAVARLAATHRLPFIAVRVIVDTAADVLPAVVVAASRAGRVQIGRLIAGLLFAPREISALIRLSTRYRTAMRALRSVAGDVRLA